MSNYRNGPKKETVWFHIAVASPKDADGMANSVNPDQTAPLEQSDLGLHCLYRLIFPIHKYTKGLQHFISTFDILFQHRSSSARRAAAQV